MDLGMSANRNCPKFDHGEVRSRPEARLRGSLPSYVVGLGNTAFTVAI